MTDKTLDFSKRHIGLKDSDVEHILHDLGYQNVDTFFKELVPDSIFNLDNPFMTKLLAIEFNEENLKKGKELYGVYCAVCHGNKGNGQGILMTREKYLGVPSYADREITEGSIYHVIFYGRNAMGSHASQVNEEERWQITQYVMELRSKLK